MSAPILVSSTPEDNAIDVALDSNIVFNFSEAVFPSTGWVSIHKASDDSMIRYFDARAGQILREFSSQITINPPYDFESSTEYYL